jgi:hypothetical protein
VVKLGLWAQEQSERIATDGRRVTPAYWLLVKALNAAREHLPEEARRVSEGARRNGTCENRLRARGISPGRAQKARRLAAFFATPDELAGLSLRQAIRLAKGESPNPATANLLRNFDRRLRGAVRAAHAVSRKVESGDERAALAARSKWPIAALGKLHHGLTDGGTP